MHQQNLLFKRGKHETDSFFEHTCDAIVAHAAPAIPYPKNEHSTTSPIPFITVATAKAFNGPHESFIPRLNPQENRISKQKATVIQISINGNCTGVG